MTKLAMLLLLAAMALSSQVTMVLADEVPTFDVAAKLPAHRRMGSRCKVRQRR
jgi:hypothetical protein